jgi:DNA mismatch repair protein MutS
LAELIATADVLLSLAAVSAAHHYRRPQIGEGYDLMLEEGRHPVVEEVLQEGSFIANETSMEQDDGRILLITGPNMAGKSTYMRQVAVICLMAQIGCFVPARSAKVPITDRIFTRIGAADDLIGGQSTFMVEMMDIQVMTEKATEKSLVIIDELGRGTSTGEGMAIAQAVIEFLHDRVGCKTLVSTHFHELAHLEESLEHLRNHCMAVKESGRQVTFLRKLIRGAASSSYGIYCAEIAGLPQPIIQRSYELLNAFEIQAKRFESDAASSSGKAAEGPSFYEAPHSTIKSSHMAPVVQLSLFEEESSSLDKHKKKLDSKSHQIIDQLKGLDLINMTPLQALNLIYEMKQKLQGTGSSSILSEEGRG